MNERYQGFRGAGGRLAEEQLDRLQTHKTSLLGESIWGIHAFDKTHLVVLGEAGLIDPEDSRKLLSAMRAMEAEGVIEARERAGGGMHSAEHYLITELGIELGGQINTGRSSGDLIEVARRYTIRGHLLDIIDGLVKLRETLTRLAREHRGSVMPGYTHGQQAQPTTFGHWAMMFAEAVGRDTQRCAELYRRVNLSPAGAAIMTGSSFGIDRERSAELLGFDEPLANTMDAILSHDLEMEIGAAYAVAGSTLGRLAEDLFLWTTAEFGFVRVPDRFCGTSSIMPQKRNPDALEAVKSTSSQALGALVSIVTAERGPTGFPILERRHTQDLLWGLGRALTEKLRDIEEILDGLQVDREKMEQSAGQYWAQVTDLASALTDGADIDWRSAHQIVGTFVRVAEESGFTPSTVPLSLLDEVATEVVGRRSGLDEAGFADAMSARSFVERRTMVGSPGPAAMDAAIARSEARIRADQEANRSRRLQVETAAARLEETIDRIVEA